MSNINIIQNKLTELAQDYADLYPKFYKIELEYIQKKAEILMSAEVAGLGSQGLRDAQCDRLMAELPIYVEYHSLKPQLDVLSRQTWIYTELSKLIRANQWEGGKE